mmetsp:Transcript_67997/g.199014  ORF Transcript_67997/g.199014 Transcript_67997/m.199014 type:complete len:399 (+) Transcript_67997:938-2134(+)
MGSEHLHDGLPALLAPQFNLLGYSRQQPRPEGLNELVHAVHGTPRRGQVQVKVCWVRVRRHRMTTVPPVGQGVRHQPGVHHSPRTGGQEQELVEQVRNLDARLMDDDEDQAAQLLADDAQSLDAELCVRGRQPRGRLVSEEDCSALGHAARQGDPPALAPRAAAHLATANVGARDPRKAEGGQQHVQRPLIELLRDVPETEGLQPEVELHRLPHSPMLRHDVLLADVGGNALEEMVPGMAVYEDLAVVRRGLLVGKAIQQGALPTSAWAHQRNEITGLEMAGNWLQDSLLSSVWLASRERNIFECQAGSGPWKKRLRDAGACRERTFEQSSDLLLLRREPLHHIAPAVVGVLPWRFDSSRVALKAVTSAGSGAAFVPFPRGLRQLTVLAEQGLAGSGL